MAAKNWVVLTRDLSGTTWALKKTAYFNVPTTSDPNVGNQQWPSE